MQVLKKVLSPKVSLLERIDKNTHTLCPKNFGRSLQRTVYLHRRMTLPRHNETSLCLGASRPRLYASLGMTATLHLLHCHLCSHFAEGENNEIVLSELPA